MSESRATSLGLTPLLLDLAEQLCARADVRVGLSTLLERTGLSEVAAPRVEEAERQAAWLASLFEGRAKALTRCGVDGVPGSGKSTLARALARSLSFCWRCLDHTNLDSPLDLSAPRTIYEHHRLFRTQDVDHFDALVYIDEPIESSRAKVLARRRGDYMAEVLDYARSKRVGRKAFSLALGEEIAVPNSFLRVKLRPPQGFCIRDNAVRELSERGVAGDDLSREQLVFLASERQARGGLLAYVNEEARPELLLSSLCRALEERR